MIKVKVKTLLLLAALLLVSGTILYINLPGLLYANKKYDALLRLFPNDSRADQALYWSAEDANRYEIGDNRIFIMPDRSSYSIGSEKKSPEQLAYSISQLERLVNEYSTSSMINHTKKRLVDLYVEDRQWDKAEVLSAELLQSGRTADEWRKEELKKVADMLATRHEDPARKPIIWGTLTFGGKPVSNAYIVLHRKDDNGWVSPPYKSYPIAITDENGVYRFYEAFTGEGLYEVGVGVMPEEVSGFFRNAEGEQGLTIKEGVTVHYDIDFVPEVRIISPKDKELITEDKLTFTWEPYPGASYYVVSLTDFTKNKEGKITGATTANLFGSKKWSGTSAIYSIKELRRLVSNSGKSSSGEDKEVFLNSGGILGSVYPGGEFLWSVDAFDSNDKKLSSSSGYYTLLNEVTPFFSLSDQGRLEGDRLVQEGRYEEAIEAYEQEGDNEYALRALGMLFLNGFTWEDNGDPAKALSYLKRISNPSESDRNSMQNAEEQLAKKQ
ncbi:hypothetical protein [Paenibacillus sp. NPDC058071]|uniref:hypothetical protein n=1 Tax=Paenibacillus sp. NPDC058071 TaxID=3346326 RepID=UPI0036DCB5A4